MFGVEADLEGGTGHQLHLVVLAAFLVPHLEVHARAMRVEVAQGGRQEAVQGVVDGLEELATHAPQANAVVLRR